MAKKRNHSELGKKLIQGLQEAKRHYSGDVSDGLKVTKLNALSFIELSPYSADELKNLRHSLGLTQEVFASMIGTGLDSYRKWEQGKGVSTGTAIRMLQLIEKNGVPEVLLKAHA